MGINSDRNESFGTLNKFSILYNKRKTTYYSVGELLTS